MSTATVATRVDTRNLEWKDNNLGSKLLQKMGWKDGQAVGKRQRRSDGDNPGGGIATSEGLRVVKRQDGLGIGAPTAAILASQNHHHVDSFAALLADLKQQQQQQQQDSERDEDDPNKKKTKKKLKKRKSPINLPKNRITHHKVRQSKFQERSMEDMKCIFAGASSLVVESAKPKKDATELVESDRKRKKMRKEAK